MANDNGRHGRNTHTCLGHQAGAENRGHFSDLFVAPGHSIFKDSPWAICRPATTFADFTRWKRA